MICQTQPCCMQGLGGRRGCEALTLGAASGARALMVACVCQGAFLLLGTALLFLGGSCPFWGVVLAPSFLALPTLEAGYSHRVCLLRDWAPPPLLPPVISQRTAS